MRYPELIMLEGEIQEKDLQKLYGGEFTERDRIYLQNKYPEYYGFWAAVAKGAAKVGKGLFKGISKRIKRKRKAKKKKTAQKKQQQAIKMYRQQQAQAARMAAFQDQEKRKKQQNTMLAMSPLMLLPLLLGE